MEAAARWQILNYQKHRQTLPQQIIMYRDGVGEGHFDEIMSREVKAIQRACDSVQEGYKPKLTFIIVQKRNHVRFFLQDPSQGDREGRLLAGTVVDSQVCSPREFDFFMCSHAGLKGTSKPTHYHVLFDENKFGVDKLTELTYALCHIYQRCTRSVSYPAPAYYAHLAAYRSRLYTDDEDSDQSEVGSQTGSVGSQEAPKASALPQLSPAIAQCLYYA
jgi:eukaryotic translation initiation factor 2C